VAGEHENDSDEILTDHRLRSWQRKQVAIPMLHNVFTICPAWINFVGSQFVFAGYSGEPWLSMCGCGRHAERWVGEITAHLLLQVLSRVLNEEWEMCSAVGIPIFVNNNQ
jgi:hypothetical protein